MALRVEISIIYNMRLNIEEDSFQLKNEEIRQYSRQMILSEISLDGQLKLKKSKVLVVGAGGIGSTVLISLAGSGIGTLGIIDSDVVERSNLHRQPIHTLERTGLSKVESAKIFIQQLNPYITINTYNNRIDQRSSEIIKCYDYVIDGSDNALTRYIVNDLCVVNNKILISGASVKWESQITIYNYEDGPCYRCLYPNCPKSDQMMSCSGSGVIGISPNITGHILALQCIKLILGLSEILRKQMLIIDFLSDNYKKVKIRGKRKEYS